MKIAIIGAGFGALAAGFDLSKSKNTEIDIIDSNQFAGGMATGFTKPEWEWSLEEHYHHVFDTDQAFKDFLAELGLREQLVYKKTKSSTLYDGKMWQIDSPLSLLRFKEISFFSRLRTGMVLSFLKVLPNGVVLEKFKASQFLPATMGQESWRVIWEPLFIAKFGHFSNEINMSWFWARVNPRTAALGYFQGGFKKLAQLIVERLKKAGVKFYFNTQVKKIVKTGDQFLLSLLDQDGQTQNKEYDLVISTLAAPVFARIIDLPELKQDKLIGLGAMTMLLRLKKKLLSDGTYWLNVNEKNWPFVAVVEHDNYMSSQKYNGESLVYLGRYLEPGDPAYKKSAQELLNDYRPYLKKINPVFEQDLIEALVFKTPFAQPISFVNQSRYLPKFNTSIKNLYWVCMQHVYPFDRGINHAVKSARKLASHVKMETSL